MTAAALLADLSRTGIRLAVAGNNLSVSPGMALTPALRETLTRHKRELVALLQAADREGLPHVLVHRLSAEDLAACADLSADTLGAYLRVLARGAMMDAGTVPAGYTQAALCEGCGPVWLWQGAPAGLKGCPWCFRRKAGKKIPRPATENAT